MIEREREREAETQEEGEAGSMQGARHGTRSWDSRIRPWVKGRCETAEPPRDTPLLFFFKDFRRAYFLSIWVVNRVQVFVVIGVRFLGFSASCKSRVLQSF